MHAFQQKGRHTEELYSKLIFALTLSRVEALQTKMMKKRKPRSRLMQPNNLNVEELKVANFSLNIADFLRSFTLLV